MTDNVLKVMQAFADDVQKAAQTVLARYDLKDSNLAKSMKIDTRISDGSVVMEMLFDNYISYIEQGRKPKQGKQPPIDALRDWALERGIPTDNSTLFLISRAIWRDGHEARPILATLEEEIEKLFDDKWADQLQEAITEELTKYFN